MAVWCVRNVIAGDPRVGAITFTMTRQQPRRVRVSMSTSLLPVWVADMAGNRQFS